MCVILLLLLHSPALVLNILIFFQQSGVDLFHGGAFCRVYLRFLFRRNRNQLDPDIEKRGGESRAYLTSPTHTRNLGK